ncbi:ribbon-helix-helix domain-containing protein [Pararhodobacter sp.]|uniref:ribbon-helix-helix domain-containing protein n=1 Tax=Pararhodobacter sp. TaxID=2127056 RepID=UPI002AFE057C|nr:ribbon-helix-helix domain-containing protein [Pararhodobacter sp.]
MARSERPLPHEPKRRNLKIGERNSSINLEEAFWVAINEIAASQGMSVPKLVREISNAYSGANLSSGIRTFIVQYYSKVADNHGEPVQIRAILKTW